ncbi:hypothetical protein VPH35_122085 [Triticum aestivum]
MDEPMHPQGTNDMSNPSPMARCSPTKVRAMLDSFDDIKQSLVEEMGFEGILEVPHLPRISLRLSIWIMARVDELSRTIYIRPGRQMSFRAADVFKVFGVPSGRVHIQKASIAETNHVRDVLSINSSDKNLLSAVEKILVRPIDESSSKLEIDSFKMAFVIFVMGHLLAPSTTHDHTNTHYWGALVQIDHVSEFDWCEYVIEELMVACSRVKADLKAGWPVTYLHACHLFLQVFYLDNLDLGIFNLPHTTFPRIAVFDDMQFRRMLLQCSVGGKGSTDFSGAMIREADQVCYTRSAWDTPPDPVSRAAPMLPGLPCNRVRAPARPHGTHTIANPQPISFRLPQVPHGASPTPITPAPLFPRMPTGGDFSTYLKNNYPKLASSSVGMLMKRHNTTTFRIANTLKTDLIQENTQFLNSLVSELGEGCICCSLRSVPCIITTPAPSGSPQCTNIYRRKLEMTESDGDHQRSGFCHAHTSQNLVHKSITSRRAEGVVGRAHGFDYVDGQRCSAPGQRGPVRPGFI